MTAARAGRWLFACTALALLALSVLAGYIEARPFLERANAPEIQIRKILAAATEGEPISVWESDLARRSRLATCLDVLRPLSGDTSETSTALTKACLAIAESYAARAPLSANAWFVAATLAYRLGDIERTRSYLGASFRTGPNEQWVAERRALFAYGVRDKLGAELLARLDADFLLLLRTRAGIRTLARRYVFDPTLREHLVGLAETTEPQFQRRFLDIVKETLRKLDRDRGADAE